MATQEVYFELELPDGTPFLEVTATFAGIVYNLQFQYNTRGGFYALTLSDADGTVRIAGRKIVADTPIMAKIPQASPTDGVFLAVSVDGAVDVPYDYNVFTLGDLSFQFLTLERI
jgi:hypothetical protein